MKKSQVSMETMMMIGAIVIIFLSISIFSFYKTSEVKNTENYLDKKDNCLKISNFISEAYNNGHGTIIKTKTNYDIYVEDKLLVDDSGVSCYYNGKASSNATITGNILITNNNGEVVIQNV